MLPTPLGPNRAPASLTRSRRATLALALTRAGAAAANFVAHDGQARAAGIAFYVLFSLLPLLSLAAALLALLIPDHRAQADVVVAVVRFAPLSRQDTVQLVRGTVVELSGVTAGTLGLLGLAGTLWAVSSMFGVIHGSLRRAFGGQRSRAVLAQKLVDIAVAAAATAFVVGSVTFTLLLRGTLQRAGAPPALRPGAWGWEIAAFLLPAALAFLASLLLYRFGAGAAGLTVRALWPGALLAAALFKASQLGLSYYLEHGFSAHRVYGPVGAIIAFLAWTYLICLALLLGAEFAAAGASRHDTQPAPGLGHQARAALRGLFVVEPGD
jgi:membrane protein